MRFFAMLVTAVFTAIPLLAILYLFTPLNKRLIFKIEFIILFIVSGLGLETITGLFRGYLGMEFSSSAGFVLFALLIFYLLKKYEGKFPVYQLIGYTLLGFLLMQGPIRLFYFGETLISFPDFLAHTLGIFAGWFLYKRKKVIYKVNLTLSVLLVAALSMYGYKYWLNYLNYGSINGEINLKLAKTVTLNDKNNRAINLEQGKYKVLDFWFIGCGACMNEMPRFQKIYTADKNNPKLQFYTVNQPIKSERSKGDPFKLLTSMGYNMPMAVSPDGLTKELKITNYPTIIVLDPNNEVIYKGDVEGLQDKINSL